MAKSDLADFYIWYVDIRIRTRNLRNKPWEGSRADMTVAACKLVINMPPGISPRTFFFPWASLIACFPVFQHQAFVCPMYELHLMAGDERKWNENITPSRRVCGYTHVLYSSGDIDDQTKWRGDSGAYIPRPRSCDHRWWWHRVSRIDHPKLLVNIFPYSWTHTVKSFSYFPQLLSSHFKRKLTFEYYKGTMDNGHKDNIVLMLRWIEGHLKSVILIL